VNTSSRFIVAIHLLVALAIRKKTTSDALAWSVNTNPVVIRRLLGELREADLVHSRTGPNGGSILARPADQITLLHVYDAVEAGQLFHPHYTSPAAGCPIGHNIEDCMAGIFDETRNAVRTVLSRKTIAQLADDILERTGAKQLLNAGLTPEEIMERYDFLDGQFVDKSLAS
jgi:DNA-binding IscR family transcriptional regulator